MKTAEQNKLVIEGFHPSYLDLVGEDERAAVLFPASPLLRPPAAKSGVEILPKRNSKNALIFPVAVNITVHPKIKRTFLRVVSTPTLAILGLLTSGYFGFEHYQLKTAFQANYEDFQTSDLQTQRVLAKLHDQQRRIGKVLRYLIDETKNIKGLAAVVPTAITTLKFATGEAVATNAKANIREMPDVTSKVLMAVGAGTKFVVDTTEGEWVGIITPTGNRGWVRGELLE